jgi:two-component system sensor histidine kinase PilS (NtrC family)
MTEATTRLHWQNALDKLPGLINIGRFSLLLSLLTFHVLSQLMLDNGALRSSLPIFQGAQFYTWVLVYIGLIVATLLVPQWQNQGTAMPNANAVADITMMAWLMYLAGGIDSSFGILMLPFITTACLLSQGRYSLLYASYASLLIVLLAYWSSHGGQDAQDAKLWLNAIMLVAGCYLVAVLTAFAAAYLARSRLAYNQQARLLDRFRGLTDLALNHVREAVVVLDEGGKVRLLNQQARFYFPSLAEDTATKLFRQQQHHWRRWPRQIFEMDTRIQEHAVRVRARPFADGDIPLLMLFIRWEQDLAQEAMALKLAALGQLTANLAHEIRNPLSAIRQANGLLQEEEQDPLRSRLNNMIDSNIARIDKMLEDVGALNKSDRAQKQAVDLMMFWRAFKQEFLLTKPQAKNSITLKVSDGKLLVWCDPMHLQQIMWNLFNNAWRHSQQNKQAIQVVFRTRGEAEISITVLDNGAGVTPEHQQRLFEPFFTTSSEGTGLGLYVARELAQANLGNLAYRAQTNAFELILPRVLNE